VNNIDNLLKQVNLIAEKYEAIAKATGENFNIFQILRLQTNELSHSKIIAELLNPQSSHDKGNAFLKLFLNSIGITEHQKYENAIVETEKITKDGRIDIAITGNQDTIIIENKIYASDQEKQLARYRQSFPNAKIIYLTLDGHEPNDNSTGGDKNTYDILLSYDSIIEWLEQCREKSADFPYLRETIAQYINVLKLLTGQTRRKEMSKEIVEAVVKSPENVIAAFEIVASKDEIKKKIVLEGFCPAMEKLAENHGLTLKYNKEPEKCLEPNWNFSLSNETLQKDNICISFQFEGKNFDNLIYGLAISAKDETEAKGIFNAENLLRKRIIDIGKNPSPPWWLFYGKLCEHWWREELADLVSKDSKIIKKIEEKITELLELSKIK
jgi:hypothetical protein